MLSTAGGNNPSIPNWRRSALVKAASWLRDGSRRTCSPRDQRTLKVGVCFITGPGTGGRPRKSGKCLPAFDMESVAISNRIYEFAFGPGNGYSPIGNTLAFFG